MNYILNKKIKYYTKESFRFLGLLVFGLIAIIFIIFIKYKPVYKVVLNGKEIGIVNNNKDIKSIIEDYLDQKDEQVAFIMLKSEPQYKLAFVESKNKTNEEEVILAIKDSITITYRMYAITLEGQQKAIVATLAEAEEVVNEIKQEFNQDLELDLRITEIYDNNIITPQTVSVAVAKVNEDETIKEKLESTVNGVTLSKPISGTITSRFGTRTRGYHTGLDIANKLGTPIKSASNGTVTYAGWRGSYGNLVIVSHGNGIETYYAHCDKLYVTEGQIVSKEDTIATVGSTGNSTGPHLHLEIRINGVYVNPQKYLYK